MDNNINTFNRGLFSARVPGYNQFLFITGDCSTYLIASRNAVNGDLYTDGLRDICSSSESDTTYQAKWYNRGLPEDPWISTVNHWDAITSGKIVYGEANFYGTHSTTVIGPKKGAYVFIRNAENLDENGCS